MEIQNIKHILAIAAGESERREPDQWLVDQNMIAAITGLLNKVVALETTISNLAARVSDLEDEREVLLAKLKDYIPRL